MGKFLSLGLVLLCFFSSCIKKSDNTELVLKATVLSAPANFAVFNQKTIILEWKKNIDSKVKYDVFLGTNAELTDENKIASDILDNRLKVEDLKLNYTYYWKVNSKNLSKEISSSSVFTFTVQNSLPKKPTLIFPKDSEQIKENEATLSWSGLDNSNNSNISYDLYFSTNDVFRNTDMLEGGIGSSEYKIKHLKGDRTYYWKVDVMCSGVKVVSSDIFSFTVEKHEIDAPILVSPVDMSNQESTIQILKWNKTKSDVDKKLTYHLYLGESDIFKESDKHLDIEATEFRIENLKKSTKYFWQVISRDEAGFEKKSEISVFTTDACGSFLDRDGRVYKTVIINGVEWLAENYAFIPDYDLNKFWFIPNVEDVDIDDVRENVNYKKYGLFYTLECINNNLPDGWHVPTDKEWSDLEVYLGMPEEGRKLDRFRGSHAAALRKVDNTWKVAANNSSGLGLLPAGKGEVSILGAVSPRFNDWAYYLSSSLSVSAYGASNVWYRCIVGQDDKDEKKGVYRKTTSIRTRMSVRLVRDK